MQGGEKPRKGETFSFCLFFCKQLWALDSLEEKGVRGVEVLGPWGSSESEAVQICISPINSERALSRFFLLNSVPFLFLSTQTLLLSQYSASLSLPFLLLNLPYISDWTYSNPPSFLILSSASFVFFANLSEPASPSTCFYSKSVSFFCVKSFGVTYCRLTKPKFILEKVEANVDTSDGFDFGHRW